MSERDCNCHLDIVLLVRSCCSQTDECRSLFRMQPVRPAHWRTGLCRRRICGQVRFVVIYRNSLASDEESVAGMSRRQEVEFV